MISEDQATAAVALDSTSEKRLLAIAATFTAEPLLESVEFWFDELHLPFVARFAPYNQIFQQLLDPHSLLATNGSGVNVLLVQLEDWLVEKSTSDRAAINQNVGDLITALKGAAARGATPYFLVLCPSSPETIRENTRARLLREQEARLTAELAAVSGVHVLTTAHLAALYPVEHYYDHQADDFGHIPYTPICFTALGTLIVRYLHALSRSPFKVIVLDCDNTLWTGVCGEDGADGIRLEPERLALQEFMRGQKDSGMLLCLASKNNETDVAEVFARHSEMPLRQEHFAAHRINWRPKSQNILELAGELNLGLDSFIFLDDNPAECAEVRANCPGVQVLQLPAETNRIGPHLRHCWAFDLLTVTAEDRRRTILYQQARQRTELQKSSLTFTDFIQGLNLKIEIRPGAADEIPRIAQLTGRTNQFNFTTRRRSETELQTIAALPDHSIFAVHVRDRFGDYGLVGVIICHVEGNDLCLDTFLLSCRVLGRGVEQRMLARAGEIAQERGCRQIRAHFIPTGKNQPAYDFLEQVGAAFRQPAKDDSTFQFLFPATIASAIAFDPANYQLPAPVPPSSAPYTAAAVSPRTAVDGGLFNRIATDLNEAGRILHRLATRKRRPRPQLPVVLVTPRNPCEATLAEIWAAALGMESVGIHDNFFDLGGDSILCMKVVFQINESFKTGLSLTVFFQNPTIIFLADYLNGNKSVQTNLPDGTTTPATGLESELTLESRPGERYLPFPLTDIQAAYWIGRGGSFALGNTATHLYWETEMVGVDLVRFEQTWQKLIDRHDMLRAIVRPDGQQQVLEHVRPFKIKVQDLSAEPPSAAQDIRSAVREEMSHQVLPGEQAPLFEIRAFKLGANRFQFNFSFDLLVVDAWSLQVLQDEFTRLYANPDQILPALKVTFRDYVVTLSKFRDSEAFRRSQAYWDQRMKKLPPPPDLPLAKNAEAIRRPRFSRRTESLEPELWAALNRKAASAGLTVNGVLLAAYADVLATWSKRPSFLINLTLFNRFPIHAQIDRLVGDFTSTTLLGVDSVPSDSFLDFSRKLQDQLLNHLDHRHVGGIQVLRKLAREERADAAGIAPVVFTSTIGFNQNQEFPCFLAGDGKVIYRVSQTPQVWLDSIVFVEEGKLFINWDVVDELFPPGMMDEMFRAYVGRIRRLATDESAWVESRCERIAKLVPGRQLDQRKAVNNTAKPVTSALLQELFEKQAQKTPQQIAVVGEDVKLTYSELMQMSRKLGRQLRAMGAQPNSLIAIVMEKGWEQVVAALSILQSGAAYVPIDSTLPPDRLFQLLKNAEVKIILTQPCLDEALVWPSDIRRLSIGKMTDKKDTAGPLDPAQTSDDLAYVIYTSGSTGLPKGVMIDHRGAVNTIMDVNERFRVSSRDKILALSSLSFDLSVYDVFGLLAAGGTIVIPEAWASRDPARWAELTQREAVTIWNSVPALMEMYVEHVSGRSEKLPVSLRLVLLSGDWIPLNLPGQIRARSNGIQLMSLGGATEASIWSILYPIQDVDLAWRSIPYGRPMANQSFHVLNDLLEPSPVWVPGQLYIGGIGLAKGYWRDAEKTAARFIVHPRTGERLYHTGDLGRYLPGGDIEFLGREDFQVKIRGFRIELGEIEAAFNLHPDVRSVVVTAIGKTTATRSLAAYVVPELANKNGEAAAIRAGLATRLKEFLAEKLPEYMIPSVMIFLDALPLTPNGKVDYRSLPEPERLGRNPADVPSVPNTEMEKVLVGIYREVLGLDTVGIHDDFFALGGDSVKAIQLVSRANKKGCQLQPIMLFRHPTIAELAGKIGVQAQPELIEFQGGDSASELIFIHQGGLSLFKLAHLMEKELPLYMSVIPMPSSILKAVAANRLAELPGVEDLASEHVSQIQRRQTNRPIILAGHCFDGLVAFEVAHQLQRSGKQVEAVVMLDTWMKRPPRWLREKIRLQAHFEKLLRQGPMYLWQNGQRRIDLKKDELAWRHKILADDDFGTHVPWTIIARTLSHMAMDYHPKVLLTRGILLVSKDDRKSKAYRQLDETLGSGEWFADGVEVSYVPGDHESVLDERHLPELANCYIAVLRNLAKTLAAVSDHVVQPT